MEQNLQNLRMEDTPPESKPAARMLLPGHLKTLLQIFSGQEILPIDLRPSPDFAKSHIYGAVNFRLPTDFVRGNSLKMVEGAFTDQQSQERFAQWPRAKCLVFYDRLVEASWECPMASALPEKLRSQGWQGRCYILKGHYREFAVSFDKYIVGNRMTQEARGFIEARSKATSLSEVSFL